MWSKQLILTMIQDDVEEFRRLLKNETEKNLNLYYSNHCADFDEPNVKRVLYQAGAFYNDDNDFNVSLLHVATAIKKIEFVKLLVEAGCDVNSSNQLKETPLHIAVHSGSFRVPNSANEIRSESIVKFLLDHGADVNHKDNCNKSPLFNAARIKSPTIARMLIAKGARVNIRDISGWMPLDMATQYGSLSVIKLLLDYDADIYNTDSTGDTAFIRATCRTDDSGYDILKLLLEKKGKCDKTISYASKALRFALSNCDLRTIKLLSDYGAHVTEDIPETSTVPRVMFGEHIGENFSEVHYAAKSLHVDVIKYVLDKSINVNVRSKSNLTPLHVATDYGRSEACKLLLAKGANVNFTNNRGHTPLYLAIKSDKFSAINFSASGHGIRPDRKDNKKVRNILIAHIAKLAFSNICVNEMDIDVIEQNFEIKRYYESCVEELQKMKIHKVYEDVSLCDILMKKDKASGFAKNEELIEALDSAENQLKHEFPIYYSSLKEDFYQEIKKQRLIKGAAIVLNQFFNFNDPFHLVNLKILSYLREDDIIKINETK